MDVFLVFTLLIGVVVAIVGAVLFIIDYAKNQPKKISLRVIGIGLAISIISFGGIELYVKHEDAVAAQQAAEKEEQAAMDKKSKKAFSDLKANAIMICMSTETVGNKYLEIWHDTIFDDSATVAGKTYTDFNDAVPAQETVYENDGTLDKIQSEQDDMNADLKTMEKNKTNNSTNKENYATAQKQVKAVNKFVRVVTSPSGTYSDYSSTINDSDTETSDLLN
jgi:hypothetical protein